MTENFETVNGLKFKEDLAIRFRKLPGWKRRLLMEDLECALENRLKVLERA